MRFWKIIPAFLWAQTNFTFSGYVKDATSGEALIGASVLVIEKNTGILTNEYGFFSLLLPAGKYRIVARYLSFKAETLAVNLYANKTHTFNLNPQDVELQSIEIVETFEQQRFQSTITGQNRLEVQKLKTLPALLGEVDVLRTITFLPGVLSAGDGSNSFYVRGGSIDQNLVLLDETVVYNPGHLSGFFSVFSPDALADAVLYKSIPAQYGGRSASVLSIRLREGNTQKWQARGGVGILASRLSVEGPLVKDKVGFLATGRRTYADLFLKLSPNQNLRQSVLYFYDGTLKLNAQLGDKHKLFASGYFGRDVFKSTEAGIDLRWGNSTVSLRWNWTPSTRLFVNSVFVYSNYQYSFLLEQGRNQARYGSGIEDLGWRSDAEYFLSPKTRIKSGIGATKHTFLPGTLTPLSDTSNVNPYKVPALNGWQVHAYTQTEIQLSPRWQAELGLRWSGFALMGPYQKYLFPAPGENPIDTIGYPRHKIVDAWGGLEPRIGLRYALSERWALKGGFSRIQQFLHLATFSPIGLPSDIWLPSTPRIRPEYAYQGVIGIEGIPKWKGQTYNLTWEIYYRTVDNVVDFIPGADILLNPLIEREILQGRAWSYGSEWMVQKTLGRFTGWISYTLSWAYRQVQGLSQNKPFPNYIDRRHNLALIMQYEISPKWRTDLTAVYATGRPITLPIGKYQLDGQVVGVYGERNNTRMPDYHRIDFSFTYTPKSQRKWQGSWTFGCYNIYGRRNMWALRLRKDPNDPSRQVAYNLYLFRWVPFVTYNFNF
ncbi:MAG: TonB-dependent receptor [Bacteroidia bacterium]